MEPNKERIEEDIRAYDEAFGASRKAGENAKKLIEISNRKVKWRSKENE